MRNWIKALGSARKPAARDPRGAREVARSDEDHAEDRRHVARRNASVDAEGAALVRQQPATSSPAERIHTLELELSSQRERTAAAATEAQKEASVARRALEEAGAARLERDEYRRVLAAAVANEKKALEASRAASEAYELVEGRLSARLAEEIFARGVADGRVRELERSKVEALTRHAQELSEVRDREWAEREERRREVQRLVFDLGEARAALRALDARLGRERFVPEAQALSYSASLARGVSLFAAVLALALAPATLLAAFSPSRAAYLTLALGLGPWPLALVTLGLGLLALGCAALALRSARAAAHGAVGHVHETSAGAAREAHVNPLRRLPEHVSQGHATGGHAGAARG